MTTDINIRQGDPDDRQSLCHLLWYADVLDIRGILPDRLDAGGVEACRIVFDHYEADYNAPETTFRSRNFPPAPYFREQALTTTREAAIERILAEAHRDDPRPLYVLAWGNLLTLSAALERDPAIAGRIRLISIGTNIRAPNDGGDGRLPNWNGAGRQEIFERFPELWWLEIDWTYGGMFPGRESTELKQYLAERGGRIGKHIAEVIDEVDWADNFRAGDTPSVLYLIDPDHNPDDPASASWAGRFVRPFPEERPRYWTCIDGGESWNFANPASTWNRAQAVHAARIQTLLDRRPAMYDALKKKVAQLYGPRRESR